MVIKGLYGYPAGLLLQVNLANAVQFTERRSRDGVKWIHCEFYSAREMVYYMPCVEKCV
jgi:hypothetical protein